MNRKKLLAALKAAGFDVENPSLDDIKAWLEEQNVELQHQGKAVDIEAAWSAKSAVTIDDDDAGDTDDADKADLVKTIKDLTDQVKHLQYRKARDGAGKTSKTGQVTADASGDGMQWSPEAHNRKAAKDRYNKRFKELGRNPALKLCMSEADSAERFGVWCKAQLGPHALTKYESDVLADVRKTITTTGATTGAPLIPEEFTTDLIDLKEDRGVVRQILGTEPMMNSEKVVPRRTGGLTVYAPGEGTAITTSDPAFDNVRLVAQKLATLTAISNESLNDTPMDLGNIVAREIAYAFADAEDTAFQLGDGTSTYYGFVGIQHAYRRVLETAGGTWGADNANLAGQIVGAGNAYSELTTQNFLDVMGRAPAYVDRNSPRWVMHKAFYHSVVARLAHAAGGATLTEYINTAFTRNPMAFGHPVVFMQTAPSVEANSQVCATFGAFNMGAKFGEVRGSMSIALSTERYFDQDMIAIRGIERVAILVHDVGNYHATAASRVPGPIVSLVTANS